MDAARETKVKVEGTTADPRLPDGGRVHGGPEASGPGAKNDLRRHKSGGGGGGGGEASIALNLTALMDILSNLLFFLLASYTVAVGGGRGPRGPAACPRPASQVALNPQITVT